MADVFLAYIEAEKATRFIGPLADYWKNTPVASVTPEAIRQSANRLYPTCKPATKNRQVIIPTQAAINHSSKLGLCSPIKVERFKVIKKEAKHVTDEWVTSFEDNSSPHLGALCRFMFETGARIGEAVALEWRHIDFEKRTASINMTKVGETRLARLTPNVVAALANIPSNRKPDEPVFQYEASDCVRKSWNNAIKRAGIEHMTPHACRHGFATKMLQAGKDVKTVAEFGGWKDIRVLLETYAHAIKDPTVVDDVFGTKSTHSHTTQELTNCNEREIS